MSDMTITSPEHIEAARILTIVKAIQLELKTGMKPTRGFSGVRAAKQYGYTGRTLKGAEEYLRNLLPQ